MSELSALFGSVSRVELLSFIFNHPQAQLRINELVRETGINQRLVSTEIKKLVGLNLVLQSQKGRNNYYQINSQHQLFEPLRQVFEKSDWTEWERPARIHHLLITLIASYHPMQEYFGLHWPQAHLVFSFDNVRWFYKMQEFIDLGKRLIPIYRMRKKQIWRDFYRYAETLHTHQDYPTFYHNYIDFWKVAYITELISFYIDGLLSQGEHIALEGSSFTDEYEDRLWEMVEEARKVGIEKLDVSGLIKDYFWIRNSYHSVHSLTEEEVRTEVRKRMDRKRPQAKKIKDPTSISSELVQIGKDMVLMQDQRKKYMMQAAYYLHEFLKEVGQHYGISPALMMYTTPMEVLEPTKLVGLKEELVDRQRVCTVMGSLEKGLELFSGKELLPDGVRDTSQVVLHGRVACGGKAVGRATLITRADEMNKVNHGDVIVTRMTEPSITPAIRRCVGIVTDEGGITSHAAVISREFNIPCIIATKTATEMIKDKDLVEVDGDTGTVRVLM